MQVWALSVVQISVTVPREYLEGIDGTIIDRPQVYGITYFLP
jgi:hypothetical protein